MFARPGFSQKRANATLSASNPVPVEALPIIHEEETQAIQGGVEDEHYHLTQDQYDKLVANLDDLIYRLEHPLYGEAVTDAALATVTTASGNAVIVLVET